MNHVWERISSTGYAIRRRDDELAYERAQQRYNRSYATTTWRTVYDDDLDDSKRAHDHDNMLIFVTFSPLPTAVHRIIFSLLYDRRRTQCSGRIWRTPSRYPCDGKCIQGRVELYRRLQHSDELVSFMQRMEEYARDDWFCLWQRDAFLLYENSQALLSPLREVEILPFKTERRTRTRRKKKCRVRFMNLEGVYIREPPNPSTRNHTFSKPQRKPHEYKDVEWMPWQDEIGSRWND
jgi:hypothetical protein